MLLISELLNTKLPKALFCFTLYMVQFVVIGIITTYVSGIWQHSCLKIEFAILHFDCCRRTNMCQCPVWPLYRRQFLVITKLMTTTHIGRSTGNWSSLWRRRYSWVISALLLSFLMVSLSVYGLKLKRGSLISWQLWHCNHMFFCWGRTNW